MSSFFNPTPLVVVDGDTAKAADLNNYGTTLDASFDSVESSIATIGGDSELWALHSQAWAETAEDVEVEVGKYSSLHWAAKSEGYADDSAASAVTSEYWATEAESTLASKADIASPTFTGVPAAPTASTSTDSSQLASTAFVHNVVDSISPTVEIPSGSKMLFVQSSAPSGWSQDTSKNDYMLRVVSSSGGGTGGSDSPILMDKVPTHSHTASSSTSADHTHLIDSYSDINVDPGGEVLIRTRHLSADQATGAAGAHTHSVTVDSNSGSNWAPKYLNTIICTKS